MASRIMDALYQTGNHEVGVINTSWAKEYVNGARITADSDNYLLVEFDGYDTDGVKKCKPLTTTSVKGFIVSTVEEESLYGEGVLQGNYVDFYNKNGEMVKLTIQEPFVRFETSAFELNTGVSALAKGQVAHYDTTKKKYIVSAVGSAHADYATSKNQYEVVDVNCDFGHNVGKATIRLECK